MPATSTGSKGVSFRLPREPTMERVCIMMHLAFHIRFCDSWQLSLEMGSLSGCPGSPPCNGCAPRPSLPFT